MERLTFWRSACVAAAVARLPRPLRLLFGRMLREHRPQHRWHYIGRSAETGQPLWQCQKCLRVARGRKPRR
jgi:hypothetical protein